MKLMEIDENVVLHIKYICRNTTVSRELIYEFYKERGHDNRKICDCELSIIVC